MRHTSPIAGLGRNNPNGGRHGARRSGECVSTFGFDQGAGAIDRQARVSAPIDRRAAAAPRRSGSHRRLHAHDLHRRRACRCSNTAARSCSTPTQTIEALADHFATALDRPARDGRSHLPRTSEALRTGAAGMGGRRRPAHPGRRRRRHDRRRRAERAADAGTPHPRRARPVATADHVRRRRRHHGDHARRTAKPPSPRCGR